MDNATVFIEIARMLQDLTSLRRNAEDEMRLNGENTAYNRMHVEVHIKMAEIERYTSGRLFVRWHTEENRYSLVYGGIK